MIISTPRATVENLFEDMIKQPHLLVAGASGSGKSVVLHGLIKSIICRLPSPSFQDGAQMILVDPKRVELVEYADTPHCIGHIGGFDPTGWARILQMAVGIMDGRYAMMEQQRVRKWQGGQLYVIIDEWACIISNDLRGKPCEMALQRLACEGRAAGVHVILATQNPQAQILPTRIRCNIDWRVALRTDNASDSRIIMNRPGCETLPTYGQGFYVKPGFCEKISVPYTEEAETQRLIRHWELQLNPALANMAPNGQGKWVQR